MRGQEGHTSDVMPNMVIYNLIIHRAAINSLIISMFFYVKANLGNDLMGKCFSDHCQSITLFRIVSEIILHSKVIIESIEDTVDNFQRNSQA